MLERSSGSDRGRPSIDWEQAFAYYASLPDNERSYGTVAAYFEVSVRTVEAHGRKDRWRVRLAQIKAEAAEDADRRMAQERADQLAEINLLIDASLTTFAQQLRAGAVKVGVSDLLRLYKLREEVLAAENEAHREARVTDAADAIDDPIDPEQRKLELIRALAEAGVLDRLQNLVRSSLQEAKASKSDDTADEAEAA